jgi:N-acetylglucosaminyldiphosphoundecaprenol N-acetyl-beta-D-mannosaminyltransferase
MNAICRTTTVGVRVDALPTIESVLRLIYDSLQTDARFLMTFANPGTAVLAQRNPNIANLFEDFDVVAPDGMGMVLAIRWVHRLSATRISFDFTSLAPAVLQLAVERRLATVVCGGKPGVAEQACRKLVEAYPTLHMMRAFDGYSEQDRIIDAINSLQPRLVLCGMGHPKQEAFLLALAATGWTGLGFTCGGLLDQLSESGLNYYPDAVNTLNLRWAYRLVMEPRRLWRRYLLDYPVFAAGLCRTLLSPRPESR